MIAWLAWGLPALLIVWIALLAWNWPFTHKSVVAALEQETRRTIRIGSFQSTLFPPGYVGENITLLKSSNTGGDSSITARKLIIVARWSDLLLMRKRIQMALIIGLRMQMSPPQPGTHTGSETASHGNPPRFAEIGQFKLEDAAFVFPSFEGDSDPFAIALQSISFDKLNRKSPSPFHARLLINEPKGTIRSEGQIGPWDWNDPARTLLSGSFVVEQADLSVLGGVTGVFTGNGKFRGPLRQIACDGALDLPQFCLRGHNHSAHLSATFRATVNGMNGDTMLNGVECRLNRTLIEGEGKIEADSGLPGKTAALHLAVDGGRIEDFLSLFTRDPKPSMTGIVNIQTNVDLPPGPPGFLKKVRMAGDFSIDNGRFTNVNTQDEINHLSESAKGMSKQKQDVTGDVVFSDLKGHVVARDGTATVSHSVFDAPGAHADISGTYGLITNSVNLHGFLRTTGKLSDTTSGLKSALLKVLTPFWKKKSVTVVPFTIAGNAHHPAFTLSVAR